jgi:hypothetical protein
MNASSLMELSIAYAAGSESAGTTRGQAPRMTAPAGGELAPSSAAAAVTTGAGECWASSSRP